MAESAKFTDGRGSHELAIWDTAGSEEWLPSNTFVYHLSLSEI
jgi:hypothetical protein